MVAFRLSRMLHTVTDGKGIRSYCCLLYVRMEGNCENVKYFGWFVCGSYGFVVLYICIASE